MILPGRKFRKKMMSKNAIKVESEYTPNFLKMFEISSPPPLFGTDLRPWQNPFNLINLSVLYMYFIVRRVGRQIDPIHHWFWLMQVFCRCAYKGRFMYRVYNKDKKTKHGLKTYVSMETVIFN